MTEIPPNVRPPTAEEIREMAAHHMELSDEEVADFAAVIERAPSMLPNTAPFDVTGPPALSVPAGEHDGLPVGLMSVGERFGDA